MKIKFIGATEFVSKGISFSNGGVYDVKPEVAEYLEKTFKNIEILEEPKTVVEKPITKTTKK
jgi:hypothetical protein